MSTSFDDRPARELLERLYAAVNAHDAAEVAALCSADVVWEDSAAPGPLYGRDAVYEFHRDLLFRSLPDVRVTLVDGPYFAREGGDVAVRLRITGTMTGPLDPPGFAPTGGRLEFETAEFSRIEDGVLVRHHVVMDMLSLARQIGAAPQVGSALERANVWLQRVRAWHLRCARGASGADGESDVLDTTAPSPARG